MPVLLWVFDRAAVYDLLVSPPTVTSPYGAGRGPPLSRPASHHRRGGADRGRPGANAGRGVAGAHGVLVLVHGWRASATCSGLRESRARLSRGNPHDQRLGATGDTCEPLSDGRPRAEPCVR
jgi:hypothetical protein